MRNRKRIIFLITLIFIFAAKVSSSAELKLSKLIFRVGDPYVNVNGVKKPIDSNSMETKPILINGRVMIPIRTIIENMGGNIQWDPVVQQINISLNDKTVILTIGSSTAQIKVGLYSEPIIQRLDVPAQEINGRTMVPLRFVSETLGASVAWDNANKTATVSFSSDATNLPTTHLNPKWISMHGITGRADITVCLTCHQGANKFVIPTKGDKIALFAQSQEFCYTCHLQSSHEDNWMAKHPQAVAEKGLLNCLTCHDIDMPDANVTGTYCNTCHWFKS